jgi:hypothetical protein
LHAISFRTTAISLFQPSRQRCREERDDQDDEDGDGDEQNLAPPDGNDSPNSSTATRLFFAKHPMQK